MVERETQVPQCLISHLVQDYDRGLSRCLQPLWHCSADTSRVCDVQTFSSLPDDDPLHAEHADAAMAFLLATLRLMHECGGSLTVCKVLICPGHLLMALQLEQLPVENANNLSRDVVPAYVLALGQVEDQLQLQLEAVGMVLHYLREEQRAFRDKYAMWAAPQSRASNTLGHIA